MAGGVAQCGQTFFVLCSQNIDCSVVIDNGTQVYNLSVYFSGTCRSRKSFAQILRNINHRHCLCVLFYRAVF